ncbi:hypothetical protein G4B88_026657 [Cannabis sativa]|uniref:Uncharacterized protein n=1 Tax=Cannabis sativa TaxID=3483 RepID=A0A7J6DNF1_CANSA|nr:hypothetical protein G4B88_026657 [Cannabis sativa]
MPQISIFIFSSFWLCSEKKKKNERQEACTGRDRPWETLEGEHRHGFWFCSGLNERVGKSSSQISISPFSPISKHRRRIRYRSDQMYCHQSIRLYDASANVLRSEFRHGGAVLDCCFHDDSSGFSAGADNTVDMMHLYGVLSTLMQQSVDGCRSVNYRKLGQNTEVLGPLEEQVGRSAPLLGHMLNLSVKNASHMVDGVDGKLWIRDHE